MDTAPVMSMDVLWPELAEQRRAFEVVMTVPREDGESPSCRTRCRTGYSAAGQRTRSWRL
jgi:hypothetical protein